MNSDYHKPPPITVARLAAISNIKSGSGVVVNKKTKVETRVTYVLTPTEKLVLCMIARRCGARDFTTVSAATISEDCNRSLSQVQKIISRLRTVGLVKWDRRQSAPSRLWITVLKTDDLETRIRTYADSESAPMRSISAPMRNRTIISREFIKRGENEIEENGGTSSPPQKPDLLQYVPESLKELLDHRTLLTWFSRGLWGPSTYYPPDDFTDEWIRNHYANQLADCGIALQFEQMQSNAVKDDDGEDSQQIERIKQISERERRC